MRNHSLCILWMKRRSSAHQVSFTHSPTSYFNSKANGNKKSASKNKPKKQQQGTCNKHSSQLLQKKAPYTSSKKTMNTLLHTVSHNTSGSFRLRKQKNVPPDHGNTSDHGKSRDGKNEWDPGHPASNRHCKNTRNPGTFRPRHSAFAINSASINTKTKKFHPPAPETSPKNWYKLNKKL